MMPFKDNEEGAGVGSESLEVIQRFETCERRGGREGGLGQNRLLCSSENVSGSRVIDCL